MGMYSKDEKQKLNAKYGCNAAEMIKSNRSKRNKNLIEMISLLEMMTEQLKTISGVPIEYADYYQPHKGMRKANGLMDIYNQVKTEFKAFVVLYRELGTDLKKDKRRFNDIVNMNKEGE